MRQYTEIQTIRFSKKQVEYMDKLKSRFNINPDHFVRLAFEEKINRDWKILITEEQKRKSKQTLPF